MAPKFLNVATIHLICGIVAVEHLLGSPFGPWYEDLCGSNLFGHFSQGRLPSSLEKVLEETEILRQDVALNLTPLFLPRKPFTGEKN